MTGRELTVAQYNQAVARWNEGRSLGEIAAELEVSIHDLHPLTRALVLQSVHARTPDWGLDVCRLGADGAGTCAPFRF